MPPGVRKLEDVLGHNELQSLNYMFLTSGWSILSAAAVSMLVYIDTALQVNSCAVGGNGEVI